MSVRRLARDERADPASFLATLSREQWLAPTLCEGWRVRDVVAHVLSYDELSVRGLLSAAVQGRFRTSAINAVTKEDLSADSPEQLLELLTMHLDPRGLLATLGQGRRWLKASSTTRTFAAT